MICEEKGVGHNRPCAVPREFFVIEKDSHKLDDGQCGMSLLIIRGWISSKNSDAHIIELDRVIYVCTIISDTILSTDKCHTFRKFRDGLLEILEATHHVRKTRSSPEILLLEAQLLPNYHPLVPVQWRT